jgi:hypothetical protein
MRYGLTLAVRALLCSSRSGPHPTVSQDREDVHFHSADATADHGYEL